MRTGRPIPPLTLTDDERATSRTSRSNWSTMRGNLSRTTVDLTSSAGIPRAEYLQRAADDMRRAIQQLNQALAIRP